MANPVSKSIQPSESNAFPTSILKPRRTHIKSKQNKNKEVPLLHSDSEKDDVEYFISKEDISVSNSAFKIHKGMCENNYLECLCLPC